MIGGTIFIKSHSFGWPWRHTKCLFLIKGQLFHTLTSTENLAEENSDNHTNQ